MFDHPILLIIGFGIACWLFSKLTGGTRGGPRSPRIWSGDTPDEEARRNTRTDANYQGWQDHGSDRGW